MMEDEVVRRRQWLTREDFLDYLGATNLIPGPNSTELVMHVGQVRAGWRGLLVAGACFILPAASIVGVLAWGYVRYGSLPEVAGVLRGIKPVVIAVVLQALWRLGRSALKTQALVAVAALAAIAAALGANELLVLAAAAVLGILMQRRTHTGIDTPATPGSAGLIPIGSVLGPGLAAASSAFGLLPLFLTFLKIGAVLFGSGYVLLAFLRADFVERLGWLNEQQLLDAVAVGQVTPGPVFTTATFIGYLLGGAAGAAVATIGIFLPAFVFVALSGPLVPRLRRSPLAAAALDGVNVASLALMAVVTWQLGRAALTDVPSVAIAVMSALLLFRYGLNSTWLVIAGALIGLVAY
jgi:chromate transporter